MFFLSVFNFQYTFLLVGIRYNIFFPLGFTGISDRFRIVSRSTLYMQIVEYRRFTLSGRAGKRLIGTYVRLILITITIMTVHPRRANRVARRRRRRARDRAATNRKRAGDRRFFDFDWRPCSIRTRRVTSLLAADRRPVTRHASNIATRCTKQNKKKQNRKTRALAVHMIIVEPTVDVLHEVDDVVDGRTDRRRWRR